jgi:hypothetical protein
MRIEARSRNVQRLKESSRDSKQEKLIFVSDSNLKKSEDKRKRKNRRRRETKKLDEAGFEPNSLLIGCVSSFKFKRLFNEIFD